MKTAEAEKIETGRDYPPLEELSELMDRQPRYGIDTLNWKDFGYRPEVSFAIAYGNREIYLKYYITEDYFKAEKTEPNQMVCEDSCVEFFVSPESDGLYYNMEFNGIGTILFGHGTGRADLKRADPEVISKVRRLATPGNKPVSEMKGKFTWTLTAAIPLETFYMHDIRDLKGKTFRANFYKCGDMLTVPHFVTWNPVGTEKPDYHRPEYFGELRFI